MARPLNTARHDLRQAMRELRVSYHRALARKAGRRAPDDTDLKEVIAEERDERRVIERIAERQALRRWRGLSRLQLWISQFGRWG